MAIRAMIANRDPVVRAGLNRMLSACDVEVVCQASDSQQAIRYNLTCEPDVVLLDLQLGDGSGLDVLHQIKSQRPSTRVIIVTAEESLPEMVQIERSGADGYLPLAANSRELIQAVERVAGGKNGWQRRHLRRVRLVATRAQPPRAYSGVPLTERQLEVLRHVVDGKINEDIAEELKVDVETVKQHIKSLFRRIGVEDRTQAALWALRAGVFEASDSPVDRSTA